MPISTSILSYRTKYLSYSNIFFHFSVSTEVIDNNYTIDWDRTKRRKCQVLLKIWNKWNTQALSIEVQIVIKYFRSLFFSISKAKYIHDLWSSNDTARYMTHWKEYIYSSKYIQNNVYSSTVYNSSKLEILQMPSMVE